jgi:hypothetical protein
MSEMSKTAVAADPETVTIRTDQLIDYLTDALTNAFAQAVPELVSMMTSSLIVQATEQDEEQITHGED